MEFGEKKHSHRSQGMVAHLSSQHLEGGDRSDQEFKANTLSLRPGLAKSQTGSHYVPSAVLELDM